MELISHCFLSGLPNLTSPKSLRRGEAKLLFRLRNHKKNVLGTADCSATLSLDFAEVGNSSQPFSSQPVSHKTRNKDGAIW